MMTDVLIINARVVDGAAVGGHGVRPYGSTPC